MKGILNYSNWNWTDIQLQQQYKMQQGTTAAVIIQHNHALCLLVYYNGDQ